MMILYCNPKNSCIRRLTNFFLSFSSGLCYREVGKLQTELGKYLNYNQVKSNSVRISYEILTMPVDTLLNLYSVMFNHFPSLQVLSSSFEHPDQLLKTDKCSMVSKDTN